MSSTERSRRSLAINDREPAGKAVDLCRKVSVRLTVHNPDEDIDTYRQSGLAGLRREKLLRITKEAIEQGALLSYEDIAFILTCGVATPAYGVASIKRDMAALRRQELTIPTRGWRHDMGRGSTHKTQILELYFSGYQFSQIEKRTHHSETAVQRYIQDFEAIRLLNSKFDALETISLITRLSQRVVNQYLDLIPVNA